MRIPFLSRKRLRILKRSPRVVLPAGRYQVVVPFQPLSTLLIVFLTLFSFYLFLRSDLFQVKALEFEIEEGALAEELLVRQKITEEVLARSILFLNEKEVERRIKEDFPTIRALALEKSLPDRLKIRVSLRVPLVVVEDKNKTRFLVDAEGLLFREAGSESLPVVSLGEEFEGAIGKKVSGQGITGYLRTLDLLSQKGLTAEAIYLKGEQLDLRLPGTQAILDSAKEIEAQIEVLTEILRRYKLAGQTPKLVDLRFLRPVVRL